ncbi:MAG: ADP-forming succinate--CoA ligase subunit beta [Leptolyngbya sp. PLA2]|nr:ADP-forming succinate--CoA ligase subunit beta [Leptolyngbya sp. PL-A2]MCQ3940514.1 ADP-forming succinate--CoA ligase subunit beta [cyanobacterium CYA1]MCZ7633981.1 ADP-forming succinate--CoA ligase subunit beta [Phycisphaerales bacterium]MDL1904366.1 ADP-forming succinate--CoA ligase subunit beta [Synechococcales cyanobacterium CNB]GIK19598.1 MAG: succinate--CoA ligase [ADP-forming] subunit beta [Planctomycetota bacterium]
MKIHEYQARELLREAGIPVPPGEVVTSIEQAAAAYKKVVAEAGLGEGGLAVVKAQVHAGGRGKAGFVKLVRSADEAEQAARFMLTHRMVSVQTGPEGLEVRKLLIAAGVEIAREYYLAITTDRKSRRNVLIASAEGGVEIEQVAHARPDAIVREPLHPLLGLQAHQARRVAFALGFTGRLAIQAADVMMRLARLFVEKDCTLAEINPLVLTAPHASDSKPQSQSVMAIDAKFNFDDNATFRHKDVQALFDPSEENPAELRAHAFGLSYIALDGNIGCLVNGAGLAMATMDVVKLHGGEPANFLDVGGSASEEAVTEAFRIILSDKRVKGILVNIFGGIMDCAVIARGVVNAAREVGFTVPLVVRLEGSNVEAGRKLLNDAAATLPTLQAATDLGDAAKKVCAVVG